MGLADLLLKALSAASANRGLSKPRTPGYNPDAEDIYRRPTATEEINAKAEDFGMSAFPTGTVKGVEPPHYSRPTMDVRTGELPADAPLMLAETAAYTRPPVETPYRPDIVLPPDLEVPLSLPRDVTYQRPPVASLPAEPIAEATEPMAYARRRMVSPRVETRDEGLIEGLEGQLSVENRYPEAAEKRSKWRKAGDIGLAALAGFARGGLPGAAAEGILQGVRPNTMYDRRQANRVAGLESQLGEVRGRQDTALKRRGLEASVLGQEIENEMKLNPPPKPVNLQSVVIEGQAYVFNPVDGTYRAGGVGASGKPKLKLDRDELGPYFYDPDDPERPIVRPKGAELKQFVDAPLSTGGTARLPAAEVYRGDREVEAANAGAATQHSVRTTDAANKQAEREYENSVNAWKSANSAVDEFNKTYRALQQNIAEGKALEAAGATKGENALVYQTVLKDNQRLVNEANAAAAALRRHGEHVRPLDSGFYEVGPQPATPRVAAPPPPVYRRTPKVAPSKARQGSDPLGLFR
jgi:hypothetical protein